MWRPYVRSRISPRLALFGPAALAVATACTPLGSNVSRRGHGSGLVGSAETATAATAWPGSTASPTLPSVLAPLFLALGPEAATLEPETFPVTSADLCSDELTAAAPRAP